MIRLANRGSGMKIILAAIAFVLTLAPSFARAEERVGDAALGALSGAVVLGPVGLVAGAVVGYTAGPAIARSWRANRDLPRHRARVAKRAHVAAKQRPAAPAPGVGGPPAQGLE
jgi:hypothetical protein